MASHCGMEVSLDRRGWPDADLTDLSPAMYAVSIVIQR